MTKCKILGLVLLGLCLTACSRVQRNEAMYQQAKAIPPIVVPKGATRPIQQPYYPIPKTAQLGSNTKPSLIPPGSQIQQYKAQPKNQTTRVAKNASRMVYAQNNWSLEMPLSKSQAWSKLAHALPEAQYKILDQDRALGVFYVLDTQQTDKKITQQTPIYRLIIQPKGKAVFLSLKDKQNVPLAPKTADRVLRAIQSKLS